jgi:dTDP-glucose 4,6-dehydratase
MRIMVTGGLGFIGSSFIRECFQSLPDVEIVNLDAMTYAASPANLQDIESLPNYHFFRGNICEATEVDQAIGDGVDAIVNFAAETHVDRSILEPEAFLRTDILGTHVLLEATRRRRVGRFLQVSTDEVYGHVPEGSSTEDSPIAPRSPYAASKAGGDLQVLAHAVTFGTPVLITRGSNTYGPRQHPEKLIPLFITNLIDDLKVPLYGDGLQIREWLHVDDHARAILHVLTSGDVGRVYNVGSNDARTNLEVTRRLVSLCGRASATHIQHVEDRPGHDRRYSISCERIRALGWRPTKDFESGLTETVEWYRSNETWWRSIKNGEFAGYYQRQYAQRGMA